MEPFECKDCGGEFPTAKEFVYHIDSCKPENMKTLVAEVIQQEISARPLGSDPHSIAAAILKRFNVTRKS
jgi:hypothetical protein